VYPQPLQIATIKAKEASPQTDENRTEGISESTEMRYLDKGKEHTRSVMKTSRAETNISFLLPTTFPREGLYDRLLSYND
jgi:hypothetical protein